MAEYSEARARVHRLSQLPPGHVPLKARLLKAADATAHGLKLTVGFLVAAPGT